MPAPWWDVAFDDHMCARFSRRTACSGGPLVWVWARAVHGLAVSIRLCARCRRQDPQHQQVDAHLHVLYDPARFPHDDPPSQRGGG